MSYHTYALLTESVDFSRRSRSCITEQANYFYNDARPDIHALSVALLRGDAAQTNAMLQGICAGPNFDVQVDNGDGTINQAKITDGEILAQTQAIYPKVAALYYDSTGAPIPG